MNHFDTVQAGTNEMRQRRLIDRATGMREERKPARRIDEADRILRRDCGFLLVRGATLADILVESLLIGCGMAAIHKGVRHMRPSDRAGAGMGQHGFHGQRDIHPVKLIDNAFDAFKALFAEHGERLQENSVSDVDEIPEDVDLGSVEACAEFYTGDNVDPEFIRTGERIE